MAGRPPTSEAPPFGKKLAELRTRRGLTQAELATQLGVSQQMVTRYERKTFNPSIDLIRRLAAFFEVKPSELIDDGELSKLQRRTTYLERAVENAKKLPRKKQKVIAELIEAYVRANT